MDDQNKTAPKKNLPGRRAPSSLIVWIIILLGFGLILVFQSDHSGKMKVYNQTQFEDAVMTGKIKEAQFTPQDYNFFAVNGTLNPDTAMLVSGKAEKFKAEIIIDDLLWDKIRQQVQIREVSNPDPLFRSLLLTFLPIILIIAVLWFFFSRQMKMSGRGAMQFGKSRARMINPDENKVKFDDVAGADEAKEEIKEIVDFLKDPLKFKMVGGHIPKGALLMGAPGTGKTLLAKAVAGEASVPFFVISGSDFVEMFVGVGASRVRDMFDQARACAPCLIFIDEIDAVGRSRFSGIGGGHDEREQTLNAMLVEMDGLESNDGIIILAATNRADVLDPALLRPGRFDRQIVMDLPDIKGRRQILDVHVKNIRVVKDVDMEKVARSTPGFSGADLANLINEAALLAARNNRDAAEMSDFEEARDKVRFGRERRSRHINDRERKITAYHEAGHALVSMLSEGSIPVHKVTIIPRGQAYLGATMHFPKEDRYTQSRGEMEAHLKVCMGGRIAEELIFKDITSGAAGDIEQATRLARAMVCMFGMSGVLGTVQYGERGEHIYLGRDIMKTESFSEETAREIDLEIRRLVGEAYAQAKKILVDNHARLITLAEALLKNETMDAHDIYNLLDIQELKESDDDTSFTESVSVSASVGE